MQTATALLPLPRNGSRIAGYTLVAAMVAATFASWSGPASLLVTAGLIVIAIARMRRKVVLMSALLLVGQSFLFAYDAIAGTSVAVAADIVGLLVGAMVLRRRMAVEGLRLTPVLRHSFSGSYGRP